jgi:uncharacterized surface protein with fasciclin (FAS1) repeats
MDEVTMRKLWAVLPALAIVGACSAPSQQASTAGDVPPVPTVASKNAHTEPTPLDAVGPGCADLPVSDDPGSLANMRLQPVAAAVESNPELSRLHEAIVRAGLTDTLNTAPGLTVFAPTNAAFDAAPALTDPARLAQLLEYHVSTTRESAAQLTAAGVSQQMVGGELRVGGTPEEMTVTDGAGTEAAVTCGDITTQNATVFLVDHVLMPS